MSARAELLATDLADKQVDVLLVSDRANVRWLTGFSGSNGVALVGAGGGARVFVTDFRYVEQAAQQLGDAWDRRVSAQDLTGAGLAEQLPAGTPRLGFDAACVRA